MADWARANAPLRGTEWAVKVSNCQSAAAACKVSAPAFETVILPFSIPNGLLEWREPWIEVPIVPPDKEGGKETANE